MSASAPVAIILRTDPDVVRARQAADHLARDLGMTIRDRARLDLVVAELATNVIRHANRGTITLTPHAAPRMGVDVHCQDLGAGIERIATGSDAGLGLGLAVVRELADEFTVCSRPGGGTCAEASVWA